MLVRKLTLVIYYKSASSYPPWKRICILSSRDIFYLLHRQIYKTGLLVIIHVIGINVGNIANSLSFNILYIHIISRLGSAIAKCNTLLWNPITVIATVKLTLKLIVPLIYSIYMQIPIPKTPRFSWFCLQDCHTDGEGLLHVDHSQDYVLDDVISISRSVSLTFHRQYDTCDDEDYLIDVSVSAATAWLT